ncbi:hypothetical protein NLJ89_g10289 [Agrocybe chaxingu]|uniref:Uncharacterized protein n=1 Tax=Agrocybe chaxingu TaxID=84603 RepID=A0A9W8JR16_9AGAR|nr:hypothetical protein NLJ89_g10289 [Agrocybe chaxingu]
MLGVIDQESANAEITIDGAHRLLRHYPLSTPSSPPTASGERSDLQASVFDLDYHQTIEFREMGSWYHLPSTWLRFSTSGPFLGSFPLSSPTSLHFVRAANQPQLHLVPETTSPWTTNQPPTSIPSPRFRPEYPQPSESNLTELANISNNQPTPQLHISNDEATPNPLHERMPSHLPPSAYPLYRRHRQQSQNTTKVSPDMHGKMGNGVYGTLRRAVYEPRENDGQGLRVFARQAEGWGADERVPYTTRERGAVPRTPSVSLQYLPSPPGTPTHRGTGRGVEDEAGHLSLASSISSAMVYTATTSSVPFHDEE